MMTILDIICCVFMLVYVIGEFVSTIRTHKYQKIWDERKTNIIRIDPAITKAKLCEIYVEFCEDKNCKVDF